MLFYALASWRRRPFCPAGCQAFSYHRRNSLAAILYTLVFASAVETVAAHFVVRTFAPRVALTLLVVSAFGGLWLLGFARSVQLRPVLLSNDTLHMRTGLLWSVDIPLDTIEHIEFGRVNAPPKGTAGYLRATMGQPNALIALRAPVTVVAAYGRSRQLSRIGLAIDDLARFQRALS